MDKSKIYLDLSKCTEEGLKNIYKILGDTLEFISPSIVFNFPIMHYHKGMWIRTNFFQDKAKEDNFLEDKTEITYPEFIKLFEGGESKEVLQVENNGWIKIEGIANEIKASGDLWVVNKYGDIEFLQELEYLPIGYATHCQPIIKPLPPKF